ncbi:MAG: indole-3-glycerol phosphate synthase TrpC [Candidatus Omnitrophota bacterium]
MDILKRIIKNKLIEIKKAKQVRPLKHLILYVNKCPKPRDFKKAVSKKGRVCIIAEIKKASPSVGVIRRDFNPIKLAKALEKAGADALSVLTDKKFFKGDLSYISKIKRKVKLPILRKDFIIDEYQVYESRAFRADAILLIARIITGNKLKKLYNLAKSLGLACLVEAYSKSDLKKALKISPEIIGINNRNLKDFSLDLNTTFRLAKFIPKGKIVVSESGFEDFSHLKNLRDRNINAVLIGEAFMRMKSIHIA